MDVQNAIMPTIGQIAHMGVTTTSAKATLNEAVQTMLQNNLRDVIFEVDCAHRIFTVSDLLDYSKQADDFSISLEMLPKHDLGKVREDESIIEAASLFDDERNRYLGVINKENALIGVVSYSDVMGALDPSVFIQKKSVGDIVRPLHWVPVTPETITKDILHHLNDVENAVVVISDDQPVGILTAKDVLRIIYERLDVHAPVSEYMTTPVDTVDSSLTIHQVLNYLKDTGFKRAIVVDAENKFLGALTQSDLAGFAFNHWTEIVRNRTRELSEMASVFESKARDYENDACTDPLTKIGNRRRFNQAASAEIARCKRYHTSLFSLIILDIDHFKKINDVHGHIKGDRMLQALAVLVNGLLREMDVFCRWGGEEFAILLPETNIEGAGLLAERIRASVNQGVFEGVSFSVSAGVGQYQQGDSVDVLMQRVDTALYRAKENGRNRVELSD